MASISSLQSALSGLLAQRTRLDTNGHNADTEGYSRQRVDVSGISQFQDQFLETRSLGERGASAQLTLQSRYFERIELVHSEPSDRGLAASLDQLWSSFDELANHPGEISQRTAVLEQTEATIDQVRFMDDQARSLHATALGEAGALAAQVNDLASDVEALNDSLRPLLLSDASPNDLLDQRDIALRKLADLVGSRPQVRDDGTVDVYVGGRTLVQGGRTVELVAETQVDPALADVGVQRLVFKWNGGGEVTPSSGEAAGLLEMANTAIPDAIWGLDSIADSLVNSVNTLHSAGQDLDGATGWNFFEPAATTAATLAMSADVADQPRHVSIAAVGAGQLDANVGQQIAALRETTGGANDQYAELVGGLGVRVGSAMARASAQQSFLQRVDEARLAARAVNIDAEMVDLVSAQRAYEASARVINSIDEMLDVLVNRLGLVGR